jgi:hypothetical protein
MRLSTPAIFEFLCARRQRVLTEIKLTRLGKFLQEQRQRRLVRTPYSAVICSDECGFACVAGGCRSLTGRDPGRSRSRMAWNIT